MLVTIPASPIAARRITQDDYDKKARELKEQQAEIATRIEQHQQGNAEYRTTLESLISLASRAAERSSFAPTKQPETVRSACLRLANHPANHPITNP